ncbi:unnamed protein product, partial [Hapterophycus canaliculatus]
DGIVLEERGRRVRELIRGKEKLAEEGFVAYCLLLCAKCVFVYPACSAPSRPDGGTACLPHFHRCSAVEMGYCFVFAGKVYRWPGRRWPGVQGDDLSQEEAPKCLQ